MPSSLTILSASAIALVFSFSSWACGEEPSIPARPATAEEESRLQEKYPAYRDVDADYRHAGQSALDRWRDWKWGLRIHWGLYCLGQQEADASWGITRHLDDKDWQKEYYARYQRFNPQGFDADQWMRIMERAGMRYFSFTSKHHEGFCMWPTKTLQKGFRKTADGKFVPVADHFSIGETPFQRDIIGELVKAGRAHGLGVSLYYSHIDWHDFDFGWDARNFWYDPSFTKQSDPKRWAAFIQKERDQITELLTWYGPIDTLCLDISWPKEAKQDAFDLARMARKLQPNIMLRNRGIDAYGDYETPEGRIPENPNDVRRPWQVIYPCGGGFAYHQNGPYKTKEWILESLIDVVAKGGNFQAGFGPDSNGQWPQEMIERLAYVGDWLKVNGQCIYATRPFFRYHDGDDIRFTRTKDNKFIYVISLKWPGEALHTRLVKVKEGTAIRMLGLNRDLTWHEDASGLVIEMPKELEDETRRPCRQAYAFRVEGGPVAIVDSPNLSLGNALPHGEATVQIENVTPGSEVHYTLDGSEPTESSPTADGTLSLPKGAVLNARAFKKGWLPSDPVLVDLSALRINFQRSDSRAPSGYYADYGETFGDRGPGLRYGWSKDHTHQTRQRDRGGVNDTFCHFLKGQSWELALPKGSYRVNVTVGDVGFGSTNTINVEGVSLCRRLELRKATRSITKTVSVTDGRLTIDCGDAEDRQTKIVAVEVVPE